MAKKTTQTAPAAPAAPTPAKSEKKPAPKRAAAKKTAADGPSKEFLQKLEKTVDSALQTTPAVPATLDELCDAVRTDKQMYNLLSLIGEKNFIERVLTVQKITTNDYLPCQYFLPYVSRPFLLENDWKLKYENGPGRPATKNSSLWASFLLAKYDPDLINYPQWMMEHARFLCEESSSESRTIARKQWGYPFKNQAEAFFNQVVYPNIKAPAQSKNDRRPGDFQIDSRLEEVIRYFMNSSYAYAKEIASNVAQYFYPHFFNSASERKNPWFECNYDGLYYSFSGVHLPEMPIIRAEIRLDTRYEIDKGFRDLEEWLSYYSLHASERLNSSNRLYNKCQFEYSRAFYYLIVMKCHYGYVTDAYNLYLKYWRDIDSITEEAKRIVIEKYDNLSVAEKAKDPAAIAKRAGEAVTGKLKGLGIFKKRF